MSNFANNLKISLTAFAKATSRSEGVVKAELAQRIGKTTDIVYRYLREDSTPSLKNIETISSRLGMHIWDILKPEDMFREELRNADFSPVPEENIALILKTNLNRLCKTTGENILSISEKSGVASETIKSILRGIQFPSLKALENICKALCIEPYELLTPTEETAQIAKYDALRIDGTPPVRVFENGVQFSVQCTFQNANRLLQLAEAQHTSPNEVIRHLLEEKED